MDTLVQLIFSGIAAGGIYALIALGFVLIYKATRIINFATGEFMMIGAYIFYTCLVSAGWSAIPAFLGVMACAIFIGFLIERLILRHMLGQPTISIVMVTIGISAVLMGLAEVIWGSEFQSFPPIFPRAPIIVGNVVLGSKIFYGLVLSSVALVLFAILFKYAKVGVAMRATASDQMASFSMGINVKSMFTLSWALGALSACIGGVLIGNIGGVHPSLGHIGLKIFPIVILGGLDSIGGAVIGAFIVGIVENLAGVYLDPYFGGGVKDIAPFVVLVLILLVKPYGLFGKEEIERL